MTSFLDHGRAIRLALVAAVIAVAACAGDSEPPSPSLQDSGSRVELATDAELRSRIDEIRLYNAVDEPMRAVFRDQAAWEAFWSRASGARQPAAPAPAVDFSRHMVVVVALGTRPSGGYWVEVEGVYQSAEGLRVEALASAPGEYCGTTQAVTHPLDAVLVARGAGQVTFRVSQVVRDCR